MLAYVSVCGDTVVDKNVTIAYELNQLNNCINSYICQRFLFFSVCGDTVVDKNVTISKEFNQLNSFFSDWKNATLPLLRNVCIVLLDFSLIVKTETFIFISGRGSAISSAKERKSDYIYNLVKT